VLEIEDLHVYYGGIHALHGISLSVPRGRIVTLVGANGAGKSTTLRAVAGLVKPRSGRVLFEGRDVAGFPAHRLVEMGMSMVPEGRQIFPDLTVEENLTLGAYVRKDRDGVRRDLDMVYSLFDRLRERKDQRGGTLSGGEQQMLAIGRALMSRPRLLMMDEPSLGLAPVLVDEVFGIIERIHDEGNTILLIEQNARAALAVADYGYVMEAGEIVLDGPGGELLEDERVRRAYMGEKPA